MPGKKHSKETKAKIAAKLVGNANAKGYKHGPEYRAKVAKAVTGVKRSPEVRAAMSKRAKENNYIQFMKKVT